jgi:hypothetical protein
MTNTNTTVEIITSTSFFTGQPVVGLAFAGEATPCTLTKWADALHHGRPATVQPLNGRPEADQIQYLIARWAEWSERTGITLTINPTPRKVAGPF